MVIKNILPCRSNSEFLGSFLVMPTENLMHSQQQLENYVEMLHTIIQKLYDGMCLAMVKLSLIQQNVWLVTEHVPKRYRR